MTREEEYEKVKKSIREEYNILVGRISILLSDFSIHISSFESQLKEMDEKVRCYLCEKGFSLEGVYHIPNQALGMIPVTPCIPTLLSLLSEKEKEIEESKDRWHRYRDADPKCRDIEYTLAVERDNERLNKENRLTEARIKELEKEIEKLKNSELCGNESYFIDAKRELYDLVRR